MESSTRDPFLCGKVILHQPISGYRFSLDAVILSHVACPEPGHTVLDLGTGCGVIPILLAFRNPSIQLIGVEIQDSLARYAVQNVEENQMGDRIRIITKDMVDLSLAEIGRAPDLVVANPPYRELASGRLNSNTQKAVARHELKIKLDILIVTARRLLARSGRFVVIYPSTRAVDLLTTMREAGLEPKSLTMIHSTASSPARLVTVTGVRGGRPGLEVKPAIHLYRNDGTYTRAIESMLNP